MTGTNYWQGEIKTMFFYTKYIPKIGFQNLKINTKCEKSVKKLVTISLYM